MKIQELMEKGNHKLVINKLFPQEKDLGVELVWYDDIEILLKGREKLR